MMRRIIAGAKRPFGLHKPGRSLLVYPDDVFVVSYPKSGNTWTRFLIANLIHPEEPATFSNIDRIVPEADELSKRELDLIARPRVLKTHQYFDPRYQRVIYVARDPRDVVVSEYHYFRKRRWIADDFPMEEFVTRFLAGRTSDYASWAENVTSWIATRFAHPNFLLLRYEDMLSDAGGNLKKIALFLGIRATPEQLAQAAERSSAEKMRELERTRAADASVTRNTREDIPFVRTACAGNWKSALSEASVAQLEAALGSLMRWLGYELVTNRQLDDPDAHLLDVVIGERLTCIADTPAPPEFTRLEQYKRVA